MAQGKVTANGTSQNTDLAGIVNAGLGPERNHGHRRRTGKQGQQRRTDITGSGSIGGSETGSRDSHLPALVSDLSDQLTDSDLPVDVSDQRGDVQDHRDLTAAHAASSSIRCPSAKAASGIGAVNRSRQRALPASVTSIPARRSASSSWVPAICARTAAVIAAETFG
ncbi:hypothetical protein GA0074694_4374 [Micromonospora inyonensis]|uniref:Uncharacterized protein n=1 Tax=Micromonospora inyonensis TaxID=47866 RepID=A0A1C6S8Z9_9ACTN|nr:hypothetical protein GA0074694_4374 [Micromonospora inyonensis]